MNAHSPALNTLQTAVKEADWEAVYQVLMPRVYNFFRYRTVDEVLAEDLTAATFMKAWRFRQQYSHDLGAFSTWLFTIAQNVARDHYRKHRDELPLDGITNLTDRDAEDIEMFIERQGDLKRLAALLAELSERERELLALKYGAELTNRGIAELTNLSESNVGTILHRVIHKLRAEWNKT